MRVLCMIALEVNDAVILEQKQILELALSTNPKTEKVLQKLIDKALAEIRPDVIASIRASLGNDPRRAANGVRRIVYKNILGGDINILNMKRRTGSPTTYEPPRTLRPGQRGGNRVLRSERTDKVMHYGPHDRAWILRIQNSGTTQRRAGTREGRLSGNRGSIAPRNFFASAAQPAMNKALQILSTLIDTKLEKILNGTEKP